MIVVGHQPQYIPYLGFFNKVSKADIFVFVDNVQFNRKSWQQRTLIKYNSKPLYLTIPVKKKGKRAQKINEVEIIDGVWSKKHWKSICLAYSKTPYFEAYRKGLEEIYGRHWDKLADFTIVLTNHLMDVIGIKHKVRYLGSGLGISGEKTNLLVDICKKTSCDTYLSGEGAKAYLDESQFQQNCLKHIFNDFRPAQYHQQGNGFLGGMGIIDVLFMSGPDTLNIIKECRIHERE